MGQETDAETEAAAPGREDTRTRVFLSYSRRDSGLVTRVAEGLGAAGFLADFDQAAHDPHNVTAGISAEDEWWKRLQEMIAAADVMVFLVSPDSAQSAVCDEEIAYARALGKRIIAALARPVDFARAPPRLSALNVRIDFSESGPGFDAGLAGLVSALEMNVGWHREGRKYYARVQEWDTAGRPKSRLLREGAVEEAERWALARPRNEPEPGELFLAWVAASRAQIRRDAAVRAFWRRVTAVFVLTTLVATVAGAWFVVNGQRNLGRSESLMLARTSEQFYNSGDYLRALHLAILASRGSFLSPSTDEAKAAFAKSAQALGHVVTIRPEDGVFGAAVSRDGQYIATWDTSARFNLWRTDPAEEVSRRVHPESDFGFVGGEFSPDGTRFLSFSLQSVQLQDPATGADIVEPIALEAAIRFAKLSRDGARFLTVGWDGASVRLYDAADAKPVGAPLALGGETSGAVFSADSQLVFSWGGGGGQIWSAKDGAPAGTRLVTPGDAYDGALSGDARHAVIWYGAETSDGVRNAARLFDLEAGTARDLPVEGFARSVFIDGMDRFVTYEGKPSVQVWRTSTGQPVSEEIPNDTSGRGLVFSAEAGRLFAPSYLTGPRLVDLSTGEVVADILTIPAATTGAVFSPDGGTFVTWSGETAIVHDPADGRERDFRLNHDSAIASVNFSGDSRLVLVTGSETTSVYDVKTGTRLSRVLHQGQSLAEPVFLKGGHRVVTFSGNATQISGTGLHAAVEGAVPGRPTGPDERDRDAKASPDGRTIITREPDGSGQLWEAATAAPVGRPLHLPSGAGMYEFATFSPDSRFVAFNGFNEVQVFDAATGQAAGLLRESYPGFQQVAVTAGGARLVTQEADGELAIWDPAQASPLPASAGLTNVDAPFTVSPAGDRLVIWGDGGARLVDLSDGALVGDGLEHASPQDAGAQFSADGARVLTFTSSSIRLWDSATGKPVGVPLSPLNPVDRAALSPDGKWIYVASGDAASVHDAETGAMTGKVLKVSFGVEGAVFSADARRVATWTGQGLVHLHETATGDPIGEAMQVYGVPQGVAFSADGARMLIRDTIGNVSIADAKTGTELAAFYHDQSYDAPQWSDGGQTVRTLGVDGEVRVWDMKYAMVTDAGPGDVAAVCSAKLNASLTELEDGRRLPFVRLLDSQSTFKAPILRGREGEDVCTPPPVAWWERAAGMVFGWAFR